MSGEHHLHEPYYDASSWSKHQLMVLQQLEDHTQVLQNLNKEIVSINQNFAVQHAEMTIWKEQINSKLVELREDVDNILYDEKGINQRIVTVERELDVEEQMSNKIKATWALYGSIAVVLVNVITQIVIAYIKK